MKKIVLAILGIFAGLGSTRAKASLTLSGSAQHPMVSQLTALGVLQENSGVCLVDMEKLKQIYSDSYVDILHQLSVGQCSVKLVSFDEMQLSTQEGHTESTN